jgi:hypothetical protein
MTQKKQMEASPPNPDPTRFLERPDGYYWLDPLADKVYGPFPSIEEARQDMESQESRLYQEAESLKEAEKEMGIADWIDPETGEPAEGFPPRLEE